MDTQITVQRKASADYGKSSLRYVDMSTSTEIVVVPYLPYVPSYLAVSPISFHTAISSPCLPHPVISGARYRILKRAREGRHRSQGLRRHRKPPGRLPHAFRAEEDQRVGAEAASGSLCTRVCIECASRRASEVTRMCVCVCVCVSVCVCERERERGQHGDQSALKPPAPLLPPPREFPPLRGSRMAHGIRQPLQYICTCGAQCAAAMVPLSVWRSGGGRAGDLP